MKNFATALLAFLFSSCVASFDPGGIPARGSAGFSDRDSFVAGETLLLVTAIATYSDSEAPTTLQLVIDTQSKFVGDSVNIEEAYIIFKGSQRSELINSDSSMKAPLVGDSLNEHKFSRARFQIPTNLRKKNFTVYLKGYIQTDQDRIKFQEKAGWDYSNGFGVLPIWTVIQAYGA